MILAKGGKKKKMSKLNIEYIKTGELIPYVNNRLQEVDCMGRIYPKPMYQSISMHF